MNAKVGILALQGGFASHAAVLARLGASVREVRVERDLEGCDALVIPGGESTTLTRLLMEPNTGYGTLTPWKPSRLFGALREFARERPTMGTCAGLIMLARPSPDERVVPLDVLPVTVERNAYGRQTESFIERIPLRFPGAGDEPYPATFIRAPKIVAMESGVETLATARDASGAESPVMVRHGKILALSFHPELTPSDARIHAYFLSLVGNL